MANSGSNLWGPTEQLSASQGAQLVSHSAAIVLLEMANGHQEVEPLCVSYKENSAAIVHTLGNFWPQERGKEWTVEGDTELILAHFSEEKTILGFLFFVFRSLGNNSLFCPSS